MRHGHPPHVIFSETAESPDDLSLKEADLNPVDESYYCYSQTTGVPFEFKDDTYSATSSHICQLVDHEHLPIPDYLVTTSDLIWHAPLLRLTGRYLRFRLFSIYARLFLIAVGTNLGGISYVVSKLWRDGFVPMPGQNDGVLGMILLAVSLNLLMALSLRNESVINTLYRIFVNNSSNSPLWFRKRLAKLYGIGGFHSGCAFSAFLWYTLYSSLIIDAMMNGRQNKTHAGRLTISILIWAIFVAIIGVALPGFRNTKHDYFELVHRFGGWGILILFWVQLIVEVAGQTRNTGSSTGSLLTRTPAFWILIAITVLIIWPWLNLRRVPVYVERLSTHVVRAYLHDPRQPNGGGMRLAGRFARLSHNPLEQSHAFATIPYDDPRARTSGGGSGYYNYSVLVSRAGDFTAHFIETPPQRVWVRQLFPYGIARVAALFQPVVLVATGSGIGPILGVIGGHPDLRCRILWSTNDPLNTYGAAVMEEVRRGDERAVIIDTAIFGRQNLVEMAYDLYEEEGAEAVVVISNKKATEEIVYGLESKGVAAYGPLFDS